jgi:pimeloyl-ACP methyl ester carboxylesterase
MDLVVNGHKTFCYTGGKAIDPAKPTVVFVHGVLNDHSVWILQSRYFANHGFNVLSPDLPGHCRSAGERCWTRPASVRPRWPATASARSPCWKRPRVHPNA